jgi:hypothetical protein
MRLGANDFSPFTSMIMTWWQSNIKTRHQKSNYKTEHEKIKKKIRPNNSERKINDVCEHFSSK